MKVSHSPCQEWGLKVISQRYDLMSSRPSDTRSVPMPVRDAAVLERTLRSALESYTFQLRTMTALFRFSGDSGQIPLELWPSWRQEEENLSSVTWCLPSRRFRSAICCQILSSSRRIYLCLPLLAQLDMPQGMCPYIKEHSLGLPRRLETTQRRPSSSSSASRGRTQSSSAPATQQRSQTSSSSKRFTPQKKSPEGVFGGRSLSPICGPVGFRGVAPHHKPIHPEHLHRIPAISHGSLPHGRSLQSVQGVVLRVDNCPSCLYTADGSNIRHSPSLRCQDAQIPRRLVDSSRIQDHWSPGEGQAPASV